MTEDLETVVLEHVGHCMTPDQFSALVDDLRAREEGVKADLLLTATAVGVDREPAAELVASVDLGEELDTASRALVHSRWHVWAARVGFRGAG